MAGLTYRPPLLPDYILRNHTLAVIVGVPTDEEVMAIHDAIRAVNSVSNVPALYDHKLATQLAQYLFTVQMAVYRNQYPSSIFPGENTLRPPTLPSHIPISLEPVVGAPSDEELESVHAAIRTIENLANSPFYDSKLNAKLSQHQFNIQLARYIQDVNQGYFSQRSASPASPVQMNENNPSTGALSALSLLPNDTGGNRPRDAGSTETDSSAPSTSHTQPQPISTPNQTGHVSIPQSNEQLCAAQRETNRLLSGNEELLKLISRTLTSTYFSVNRMHRLHNIATTHNGREVLLSQPITTHALVGYLRFYGIGIDIIDEVTGNLKPGKEEDAKKLLAHYLYNLHPPTSQVA